MSDRSWEEASGSWERLRWARERFFDTSKKAADSLGVPATTYRQYERAPGTSRWVNLDEALAKTFAKKYKVDWVWLLTGAGSPLGRPLPHALDELLDIYGQLSATQQHLLIELARNMSGPGDDAAATDSLPSAPKPPRVQKI